MVDRTIAPKAAPIDSPKIPEFEQHDLDNGLNAHVLNQGSQPVTLLDIVIPVGRWEEPKPGLAYYLFKMLSEGTTSKNADEIASLFDFYGSHLEITPTLDAVEIKLYVLNRFFKEVVSLLGELISEPGLGEKEFQLIKSIRVQQIRQQHAKNNAFANLKIREMLYGSIHPYGRIIDENAAEAIQIEDVHAFKKARLTRPEIFLAGAISSKELDVLKDVIQKIAFSEKLVAKESFPDPQKSDQSVHRENSTQASLRAGQLTIDRTHPDIHRLKITNELLGGFFGSRLMKNIREEKGLTYGIYSTLLHLHQSSYWMIGSEVLSDKVALTRTEIVREVDKLRNQPPEREEFNTLINYMKGKYLNSFDTPFSALNMLKTLKLGGVEMGYFENYSKTLDEISPDDIRQTAETYLNPENFKFLVVR